ncbi:hypothetical protein MIR68_003368 [Amoeboaphelidium protococcarum]|nr:hypothetical protein MIR68_003368 [Amoeboaphelidium protococcarum]
MVIRLIQKSRLASTSKFGVALDIDGVLIRGGQCLKGTRRALEMLNGDNKHNRQIPHVFLTNGGGLLHESRHSGGYHGNESFDTLFCYEVILLLR